MEKNLYLTGGQPLRNDDLRHAERGIEEAILNILSGLGRELPTEVDSFRLFGADITVNPEPGNTTWTAGAIVMDGEVFTVDAGSIATVDAEDRYWQVDETFLPNNPRTFEDSSTKNVNAIRKATLVYAAAPPADSKLISTFRTIERGIRGLYQKHAQAFAKDDWVAPTLINNWVNVGGGNTDAQYRIGDDNTVYLRGQIKSSVVGDRSGVVIFSLPAGARPAKRHKIVQHGNNFGGGFGTIYINIETTGSIAAFGVNNSPLGDLFQAGDYISLDGVQFHAEL